jgi:hypothetical protein
MSVPAVHARGADCFDRFVQDVGYLCPNNALVSSCGRYCIHFAVSLLHPSSAEMALHYDANVVRAIVGARQIKFLSGPAGSEGQDALA